MKQAFFFLLLLQITLRLQAQTIHLKITDASNNETELAYVNHTCASSENSESYFTLVRNGFVTLFPLKGCTFSRIAISAPGYKVYFKELQAVDFKDDTVKCILLPLYMKDLQPVIVTANPQPIQIRNDTTIFRTKAFSNGTELKLSDLLEKLPGIEINKRSGEIRFKGKPIETILVEGENLFGTNYTLASRNIHANLVTEVQAIENYSENYVLKGLEQEEHVALNIKIVKTKMKVAGNSEAGFGMLDVNEPRIQAATDVHSNMLGLGQMHKFFTTVAYNNTGINNSPEDYFGNNFSIEQLKDRRFAAQKFIYDPSFATDNSKNYCQVNNQLFGNYNGLLKATSKITVKGSFYFVKDRLYNRQQMDNLYFLANDTINTIDLITGQKNPRTLKSDLNFRFAISSTALLEASLSDTRSVSQSSRSSSTNYIPYYQTNLHTQDNFRKLLVTYTQRIDPTRVLQIELKRMYNCIDQNYLISPSAFSSATFPNDHQLSNYKRASTLLTATLFGSIKKTKYKLYFKGTNDHNTYTSGIVNSDEDLKTISHSNHILYTKPSFLQGGSMQLEAGKLKLSSSYNLTWLQQHWKDVGGTKELYKNLLLFEPALTLKYKFTNSAVVSLQYSYSLNNTNDQFLYPELVLQNFRTATKNTISLSLLNTNVIRLNFTQSDLFNQFDYGLGGTFQTNGRDYLPAYTITDSLLYTRFSMQSIANNLLDLHAYINKYVPLFKTSFKCSVNKISNTYNNYTMPGIVRNNIHHSTILNCFIRTMFEAMLNFEAENSFVFRSNKSNTEQKTSVRTFYNSSKLIFSPDKNLKMHLSCDYYLPDMNFKKNNLFINYGLSYKLNKKNTEMKLVANNLTNTQQFYQYQVSDFSRSIFNTNTLARNLLLYFTFQF